jgi:predicted dienelactone hydrolase
VDSAHGITLHVPSSTELYVDQSLFPWPAVLFVPGFNSSERGYRRTALYLASHGVVVAAVNRNLDIPQATLCRTQVDAYRDIVLAAKSQLYAEASENGLFPGLVDRDRVGAAGHSLGGKMALWLALEEPDVRAVFALDPVDGSGGRGELAWCRESSEDGFPSLVGRMEGLGVPVAMVGAGMAGECAPSQGNSLALFGPVVRRATHYLLPGADHADFTDAAEEPVCPACAVCPQGDEAGADVLHFTRTALTAFMKLHLVGDERYRKWTRRDELVRVMPRPDFAQVVER